MSLRTVRIILCAVTMLYVAGCAAVAPTQRGTLASPDMQFDADIGHARILLHTYSSKEAASGGQATGGGGCGCT